MFQVESDLHIEFRGQLDLYKFLPVVAPYLILAGDLCPIPTHAESYRALIKYCSEHWVRVFIVAGNHEYYNSAFTGLNIEECNTIIRDICSSYNNVHFLQKGVFCLENMGIAIIGATMWSNTTHPIPLNEYRCVFEHGNLVTHKDTHRWFLDESKWISDTIDQYKAKYRVLVITHHMPSFKLIADKYKSCTYNIGFASDLDHLLAKATWWVCGHTHTAAQHNIEGCHVYINPRGYPGESTYNTMCFEGGAHG